jgi:hypothetical protein
MSSSWPIRTTVGDDPPTLAFLEAVAADLRTAGGEARLVRRNGRLLFRARVATDQNAVLAAASRIRARQRDHRQALLERAARRGLQDLLSPNQHFNPEAIVPRIVWCASRAEHDVFAYAKLNQSVPSAPRAGRRMRLLLFDQGQREEALIGVVELASSVFSLGCRDRAFGWTGDGARDRRASGLRGVMDLSTCLALPPYAGLRAGKLLAAIAASDAVSEVFEERYGDRLAAIVATCATGLHYPQLNRITLRPGGLFKRVGATAGYSTWMYSRETLAAARALACAGAPAAAFGPSHVKVIRLLRSAFRRLGLDDEQLLRTDLPKGVYLCDVTGDGFASLHDGAPASGQGVAVEEAVRWWRRRVLEPLLHRSGPANAVDAADSWRPMVPSSLVA